MADTPKLVSYFNAWRLTIGLEPLEIEVVIKRCVELGLLPKVCGQTFLETSELLILLSVTVPCCVCSEPQEDFIEKKLDGKGKIVDARRVSLICPIGI